MKKEQSSQPEPGGRAPDFELPDLRGGTVRLSKTLRDGPVVLVFYRGGWCPMCNRQLARLSADYEQFTAAGARILAISNEEPTEARRLLTKIGPPFRLLHDADSTVIKKYGILAPKRDVVGWAHRRHNYASPAVFIIAGDGAVRWRYVGANFKDRPDNAVILQALRDHLHSMEPGAAARRGDAPLQRAS